MTTIITGGSGSLGSALKKRFTDARTPSSKEVNVTNRDAVFSYVKEHSPTIFIHTAAWVGIRECEEDKVKAWNINVQGTQNVVDALKTHAPDCYLIYISTACAFAGEKEQYYTEDDTPSPKNFYSLTKVCGEVVTRQHKNTCIIRTNFTPCGEWPYPKAFTDRFGTYLLAPGVARGIKDVIDAQKTGIIHIVGDKRMSMFELAQKAGSTTVKEMTLDEYSGPPLTVDMSLGTKHWHTYSIDDE